MKAFRHFWRGVASVLVLSPAGAGAAVSGAPRSPADALAEDALRLAGDWHKVGGDVRAAFDRETARLAVREPARTVARAR